LKSTEERFGNTNRYFSSGDAQEPNTNIHLMRKRQGVGVNENIHQSHDQPSDITTLPMPRGDSNLSNGVDDEDLNNFLDEIGQEIDRDRDRDRDSMANSGGKENNVDRAIKDGLLAVPNLNALESDSNINKGSNKASNELYNNPPQKENIYKNDTTETKGSSIKEVIEKKIYQDLDKTYGFDETTLIPIDHDAGKKLMQSLNLQNHPHLNPGTSMNPEDNENENGDDSYDGEVQASNSTRNISGKVLQPVNQIVNDQAELKAINDMDNNYSNNTDIKMIRQINKIKSPYIDPATLAKANIYTSTYPLIPPNRTKYIIREYYVTVDSINRDLEKYPDPTCFQVKFAPASDCASSKDFFDKNGNFIYQGEVRFVGDDRGAFIDRTFENIYSIGVICAIVPFTDIWIAGNCPSAFNGPVLDFNKTLNQNNFPSVPNGPIFTDDVGVQTTILDEPYIIMKIDELESWSPYFGTNIANKNAFAKLVYIGDFGLIASFVKFGPCDPNERMIFVPQALAKLDKMTISLRNFNNMVIGKNRDKTYVKYIDEGNKLRNCDKNSTRITICPLDNCIDCTDNGHCLKLGELLYFYQIKPDCEHIYNLNKNIKVDSVNFIQSPDGNICQLLELVLVIHENGFVKNDLCLNGIIEVDDYIAITYKNVNTGETKQEVIKIISVDGNIIRIKVDDLEAREDLDVINITCLGIGKANRKGIQSDNECNLNFKGGVRVSAIIDAYTFEVNVPYTNLSCQLTSGSIKKEIFFVRNRFQISYTFRIETLEKDYHQLDSEAVF